MLTTCPIDGARLIQHLSHRWPCMEQSGCSCPSVGACPECTARAVWATREERPEGPRELEKKEARALMQRSFEARAARAKAAKAARSAHTATPSGRCSRSDSRRARAKPGPSGPRRGRSRGWRGNRKNSRRGWLLGRPCCGRNKHGAHSAPKRKPQRGCLENFPRQGLKGNR